MTAPAAVASPDRGSATVLVLGLCAVLLGLGALLASVGAVSVARHRAALAADLAALAAAERAHRGPAACEAARSVAVANGATLPRCVLTGPVAEVTAEVRPVGPLAGIGSASARARAGPATAR